MRARLLLAPRGIGLHLTARAGPLRRGFCASSPSAPVEAPAHHPRRRRWPWTVAVAAAAAGAAAWSHVQDAHSPDAHAVDQEPFLPASAMATDADGNGVTIRERVKRYWDAQFPHSYDLSRQLQCLNLALISQRWFVQLMHLVAEQTSVPWMSALAIRLLDFGVLGLLSCSESDFLAQPPDTAVSALAMQGIEPVPYYCCPVAGIDTEEELDDNEYLVTEFVGKLASSERRPSFLVLDVEAFATKRILQRISTASSYEFGLPADSALTAQEKQSLDAAVLRLSRVCALAHKHGIRVVLDTGTTDRPGLCHLASAVSRAAIANGASVYRYYTFTKHGVERLQNDVDNAHAEGVWVGAFVAEDPIRHRLFSEADADEQIGSDALSDVLLSIKPLDQGSATGASHGKAHGISLVLSIQSPEWARLAAEAIAGSGLDADTGDDVWFAQYWRLADVTSLGLAASGYRVLKIVPVGTVDGRVSWVKRLLIERGLMLVNNPDSHLLSTVVRPP